MKPILFNTDMVRAILDGRKSVTRRIIKPQIPDNVIEICAVDPSGYLALRTSDNYLGGWQNRKAPYIIGDILYVRETWCKYGKLDAQDHVDGTEDYYYRADGENPTPYNDFLVQHPGRDEHRETPVWRPSIHMPKEAARLFLRVTEVRVERVQDITPEQCIDEGVEAGAKEVGGAFVRGIYSSIWDDCYAAPRPVKENGIITHYESYPWEAIREARTYKGTPWKVYGNPWVFVIEFKRISKEAAYYA